jgi:hypothetical protein
MWTKGFASKEELVENLVLGMDKAQDDTDIIYKNRDVD